MRLNPQERVIAQSDRDEVIVSLSVGASRGIDIIHPYIERDDIRQVDDTPAYEHTLDPELSADVKDGLLILADSESGTPNVTRDFALECISALELHITRGYN
jgi:hypothetical protein